VTLQGGVDLASDVMLLRRALRRASSSREVATR
jgi:hypothetical protein